MWYFAWILGLGFAVLLAILNALWLENADAREKAFASNAGKDGNGDHATNHQAHSINNPEQDKHKEGTQTEGNPTEDAKKTGDVEDNEPA